MSVYVLLEFEDDKQAKTLVEDMVSYPNRDILTPSQENNVRGVVRAVFKKPTLFCDPSDGHRGGGKTTAGATRGKKYGWWVCSKCGKPSKRWAEGFQWYGALGTNLLPLRVLEKMGLAEHRPSGWHSDASWTFLLDEDECDWDWVGGRNGSDQEKRCYDHNRPLAVCEHRRKEGLPLVDEERVGAPPCEG